LEAVLRAASKKLAFFRYRGRFFVYSMLAGAFCSLGMAFAYSVGSAFYLTPGARELYRLSIGVAFSLSFTLIIFAGCELFTSNVLVMTVGSLSRTVGFFDAAFFLLLCYAANLVGAAFAGWAVGMTGLLDGPVGELIAKASIDKAELLFVPAFFRGILCNTLVCLGYWAMIKARSEAARLIVIVWVVAGFVTPGYEHSIANAGIFSMAFMTPGGISTGGMLSGVWNNLLPVTLGNLAGGALLVGVPYWIAGRGTKEEKEV
jgi:nitrite transporter NirC